MSSISDQLRSYGKSTGPRAKGFRLASTIDTSQMSILGCGGKFCKILFMGLSIFLVVTGIGVLAGGGYATNNMDLIDAIGSDFTNTIIAFGCILIVLGTIGLCGAKQESRKILSLFLAIMGLMTLGLLIFGAWTLSNLGKEAVILSRIWQQMSQNQKDHIEKAYYCCGATSYGIATDPARCPCTKAQCGACFPLMITDFRNLYTAFGTIFIIVAAIMLATIITAFCLMKGVASAEDAKAEKKKKAKSINKLDHSTCDLALHTHSFMIPPQLFSIAFLFSTFFYIASHPSSQ